jgi:hypothetical protein
MSEPNRRRWTQSWEAPQIPAFRFGASPVLRIRQIRRNAREVFVVIMDCYEHLALSELVVCH